MSALSAERISFSYYDVPVFRDVSFNVEKGSFTALIGSNGTGKSTLVKLLLGELEPQSGCVRIFGEDVKHFHSWPRVGYVPQEGLTKKSDFPASVYEIVAASLYAKCGMFHYPTKEQKAKVYEALDVVGMKSFSKRLLSELSGGQRQRVLIARALVSEPELMILDEPITGMDAESTDNFYRLISSLNKDGRLTIFMVTHDLDRISRYVSDIYCLEYGSMVHLSPEELEAEQGHRHTHTHISEEA